MHKQCEWQLGSPMQCNKVATMISLLGNGKKMHYCVEHYDFMAEGHKKWAEDKEDTFSNDMVDRNGW
jgi:hypothetical protein